MSRLTPQQLASIARAGSAEQAIAAIAALRPASTQAPARVREPASPTALAVAVPPARVGAGSKPDGGDLVALARSVGLAGLISKAAPQASPQPKSSDDDEIVALVRSAGLAGFKRQNEEKSK